MTRPPKLVLVALVASLGLLAGCVTVPEFRALESDVAALKRGRSPAEPAGGDRLADLGAEVTELRDEIGRLRGELEEVRHTSAMALDVARSAPAPVGPTAPSGGTPPSGAGPADALPASSPAPSPTSTPSLTRSAPAAPRAPAALPLTDEVRAYEEAFRYYRAGEYRTAIDHFRGFLEAYERSDYADNALFWLGECYFKLGDHERAVLAFEDVTKRYPEGNKVPDALYRQGIALLEIGKATGQQDAYAPAAREVFERIVRDFPDSERVPEARRQLEKFGT